MNNVLCLPCALGYGASRSKTGRFSTRPMRDDLMGLIVQLLVSEVRNRLRAQDTPSTRPHCTANDPSSRPGPLDVFQRNSLKGLAVVVILKS